VRPRFADFVVLALLAPWLAAGCWPVADEAPAEPAEAEAELELPWQPLPLEGSPTAYGMLRVVNELGFAALDDEVGLDRRAAASILAHRAGPDAYLFTADDRHVEDLAQLDALHWLGEANLWRVQAHALTEGWVPAALPDGCDAALAEVLEACQRFATELAASVGPQAQAEAARWSCVETSDDESPASAYFAAAGLPAYRDPALGYHALLCADGAAPICTLGVAGLATHALPECVAVAR
jgi:hypothetical protein